MADTTRLLLVASEVAPFSGETETSSLVRALAEGLRELGDFDTRLTTPRYGFISERRNRLHEVIRLSGSEIPMGDSSTKMAMKVASIPDARIQVYFVDAKPYFKKKGVYASKKTGEPFEDNPERAVYFARSVRATLEKLNWTPDVVHAVGAMSGLVPALIKTEFMEDERLAYARVVYTPDAQAVADTLDAERLAAVDVMLDRVEDGATLVDAGCAYADACLFPSHVEPTVADAEQMPEDEDEVAAAAAALYARLTEEAVAA